MDMIIGLVLYYQHYMLGARIKAKKCTDRQEKMCIQLTPKKRGCLKNMIIGAWHETGTLGDRSIYIVVQCTKPLMQGQRDTYAKTAQESTGRKCHLHDKY